MKKESGSIADIMSALLVVLASAIVMFSYLSIMQLASINEEVKQLSRKYILEMESKGYLEAASSAQLKQQLMDLGVKDIELTGTTFSDVGYGNPIYLTISCSIPYKELNMTGDLLSAFFEDAEYGIIEKRMSTAKN